MRLEHGIEEKRPRYIVDAFRGVANIGLIAVLLNVGPKVTILCHTVIRHLFTTNCDQRGVELHIFGHIYRGQIGFRRLRIRIAMRNRLLIAVERAVPIHGDAVASPVHDAAQTRGVWLAGCGAIALCAGRAPLAQVGARNDKRQLLKKSCMISYQCVTAVYFFAFTLFYSLVYPTRPHYSQGL